MKLSARLQVCADLVRPGGGLADIGTDHGHLPIYLLKNNICTHVIAADLREKPLQFARQNASLYGVKEHIEFILSDGLTDIPRGGFQTVVCAGMGGETICNILLGAKDLWTPEYRFILQPQSAPYELREFLGYHGFTIERERLARDGKFVYTVMEVVWGKGTPLAPGQCYRPQGEVCRDDELYRDHITRMIGNLKMTVEGLRKAKDGDEEKLRRLEEAYRELCELEEDYAEGI